MPCFSFSLKFLLFHSFIHVCMYVCMHTNCVMLLLMCSDVSHVKAHTMLLTQSDNWEQKNFDKKLLLKGNDLQVGRYVSMQVVRLEVLCSSNLCVLCIAYYHVFSCKLYY